MRRQFGQNGPAICGKTPPIISPILSPIYHNSGLFRAVPQNAKSPRRKGSGGFPLPRILWNWAAFEKTGMTNRIEGGADLDGVISTLTDGFTEALLTAAEGVHA